MPIAALTAWQGLIDRAHIQSGQRVLIHGASGGVGVFAVQLAHELGAYVFATASARNRDFVKQLGADEFIDYTSQRFEDVARDIDVVFDGVGGETFERSFACSSPAATSSQSPPAKKPQPQPTNSEKRPSSSSSPIRSNSSKSQNSSTAGKLKPVIDAVVPFADAASAYDGSLKNRQGHGKIVVAIDGCINSLQAYAVPGSNYSQRGGYPSRSHGPQDGSHPRPRRVP